MSNTKNTPAKSNDTVVEQSEADKTNTVPSQVNGTKADLIEDGNNVIVINEDDIVDEPSFFEKAKTVVKRNRKLLAFAAVAVVTGLLYKLAQNVELEEDVEISGNESDASDETLEV